ncbi:signal peptidase II [Candidatus Tisiphia endosymbiont of Nemotelus uliginosus]|uniref:signal peptidase II n=1 Tax=Candidatus Tisiphia endosymbiont of Nemotelus uliginosus TaxID=3077926 RepID=UPI0035C90487
MYIPFKLKKFLLIIRRSSNIMLKLVIIDQAVKWWFINYFISNKVSSLKITSFLHMVESWNYGISFGLLRHYYQYSNMLFSVLNSAITIYLWSILVRCKSMMEFIGYSFIVGGAVGNLMDRWFRGGVFDFIYFHYKDIGFPIFNLADSFISLGVGVLLYDYYQIKKIVEQRKVVQYNDAVIQSEANRIRELAYKHNMNEGD